MGRQAQWKELTGSFKEPLISGDYLVSIFILKVQQRLQMERRVGQNHLQRGDVLTGEGGGSWGIQCCDPRSQT